MRSTVLVLSVFLAALTASAQQQPSQYRLERIVVEGSLADDDIIRGEARLPEERMYTEADFRDAVDRVRRLPFVTDAVYRIEPGVTAGGTTLVIRILDVARVFYELDLSGETAGEGETTRDGRAFLGGRYFLENLGMIEGGVQDSDEIDGLDIGLTYRAYNIMGTGGFATLTIAQRLRSKQRDYAPTMVLTAGYPLTRRQTITLSASRTSTSVDRELDVLGDDDDDEDDDDDQDDNVTLTDTDDFDFLGLRWLYESIDDPFFATRGLTLSAGPHYGAAKASRESFNRPLNRIDTAESEIIAYGLGLDAAAYQRLFGRTVGFVRVRGDGSREDESEIETLNGAGRVGLAFDFHRPSDTVLRPFKARVEVAAGYSLFERSAPTGQEFKLDRTFAEAGFVMRHRWGTLRLTGIYETE